MHLSIMLPFVPRRLEQAMPYAGLVKWTDYRALWQGQGLLTEGHQVFAAMAGMGLRVPTGLGVSLMPLRHPYQAAVEARSLALLTGEPVVAGFGPGALQLQRSVLGRPYSSQLGASREFVRIVRSLLDDETVDVAGAHHSLSGELPRFPHAPVEVGLGVLRSGMARLAGEVADVAIQWLTPADYVARVIVPALREGAEAAGRPAPRIVAIVPLALAHSGRDPVELAVASNQAHLSLPHYQAMLRAGGADIREGDLQHNARELVEHRGFLYGSMDELRVSLKEYEGAGVDEVVLNVTGICNTQGPTAAVDELSKLIRELHAGVPE